MSQDNWPGHLHNILTMSMEQLLRLCRRNIGQLDRVE